MEYRLPWSLGALVAANAISECRFKLPFSEEEGLAALQVLQDHDWFCRMETKDLRPDKAVAEIPPPGPRADWLEGYASVLSVASREFPLPEPEPRSDQVAVVGLLLDRHEADRLADVAEIKKLLEQGLGVTVTTVWPDGSDPSGFENISRSGFIVSLPYGRDAARILAERVGARLIATELPMGLGGTADWLRQIAGELDRGKQAEAYISRQLDRFVPRLEWIVQHRLLHTRIALVGDPFLVTGLTTMLREMGCRISAMEFTADGAGSTDVPGLPGAGNIPGTDILLTNRSGVQSAVSQGVPFLELGFPNSGHHSLYGSTLFGFEGTAHVVELIVNRLAFWEWLSARESPPNPRSDDPGPS